MKTSVDTDLTIEPSEEAKICLTCDKRKCTPNGCRRLKQKKKELKQKQLHENKKSENQEEISKCED